MPAEAVTPRPGQHIIVGLSGGVDSSVTALLLKAQGYKVTGLFMKNWEDDDADGHCPAAQDLQDVMTVCERLGIGLELANFSAEYRDRVFCHFLDEYAAGRTPNPDILCNREIKFRAFLDHALDLGADWIATGHYARVQHGAKGSTLHKAADANKDQTYFLHALGQRALRRSLFPLADIDKPAVRRLAAEAGLVTHDKKDSTGICFIGERDFRAFMQRYLPAQPGPICTPEGERIGTHQGLMYHTVGQRRGLGIGGRRNAGDAPWYAAVKDLANNRLIVVQGHDHPMLYSTALEATEVNWIAGRPPAFPLRCQIKVRYRQADQGATVEALDQGHLRVRFDTPQRAVAPGQSVVFYQGDACLGGGIIARVDPDPLAALAIAA